MLKREIIAQILKESCIEHIEGDIASNEWADNGYSSEVVLEAALESAADDSNIRTCYDFSDLNVACCDICHHFDPANEMALINIESGGNAWICCALDRALNPETHARPEAPPRVQGDRKGAPREVIKAPVAELDQIANGAKKRSPIPA